MRAHSRAGCARRRRGGPKGQAATKVVVGRSRCRRDAKGSFAGRANSAPRLPPVAGLSNSSILMGAMTRKNARASTWRKIHLIRCLGSAISAEHVSLSPLRGKSRVHLLKRMVRETDTGLVMILALWVEQALTDLLSAFLVRDPRARQFVERLSGRIEQKLSLSYALGILWLDLRDEAETLIKIRNRCAHRVLTGTFRDHEIADLVDKLEPIVPRRRMSRRRKFIHAADRVVYRIRVAKRLVGQMWRGDLTLVELRSLCSDRTLGLLAKSDREAAKYMRLVA